MFLRIIDYIVIIIIPYKGLTRLKGGRAKLDRSELMPLRRGELPQEGRRSKTIREVRAMNYLRSLQLLILITFLKFKLSSMSAIARVSKRYQVIIPGKIRKILDIKEGDRVLFEIEGDEIRIRKLRDFLELEGSLKGKPFSPEEIRERAEEEIAKDAL